MIISHAKLANIKLDSKEVKTLKKQLAEVVGYFQNLAKVDTRNVEPTSQTTDLKNVFRKDNIESTTNFSQEDALSASSQTRNGYFKVKGVLNKS